MIFSTVFGPHEPALTVGSLAITADRPAVDRGHAGDHAVGAEALLVPVGQQRVLDEGARVHQPLHPLADRQLALLLRLLAVALRPAGAGALEGVAEVVTAARS